MATTDDEIIIQGIDFPANIGVPEAERRELQVLQADIVLQPLHAFSTMQDDIAETIDYDAVAKRVRSIAATRPRSLIETLAVDIAETILKEFNAKTVAVEIRKRILPGVQHVGVRCRRSR
jgi:7,8-dihydroneopterin aldolase/epimerase/oxygenase